MQVGATERNGLRRRDDAGAGKSGADQVLEVRSAPTRKPGAPIRFGRAFYYVAILGKPSTTDRWMLQYGGHHLAINVIFAGRDSVLTPTHTGAQPATTASTAARCAP